MRVICTLCYLLVIPSYISGDVAKKLRREQLLKKLASATTHEEYLSHLQIITDSQHDGSNARASNREAGSRDPLQSTHSAFQETSMVVKVDRFLKNYAAEAPPTDGRVIEHPSQTADSCKLLRHCVPIPVVLEADQDFFPRCVQMQQCVGGCCNGATTCKATNFTAVYVKVRIYNLIPTYDGKARPAKAKYIRLNEHHACTCSNCRRHRDAPDECGPHKRWKECECICDNEHESTACTGENQAWNADTCRCQCSKTTCSTGHYLDPERCS